MRKFISLIILFAMCLTLFGCNKKNPDDIIQVIHKDENGIINPNNTSLNQREYSENKWNYWILVDNMPYFRTEKESNRVHIEPYDGILDGENNIDGLPSKNGCCNFGSGFPYMYTNTIDEIDVLIDGVWYIFERDMAEINVTISELSGKNLTLTVANDKDTVLMYSNNYTLEFLVENEWVPVQYIGNENIPTHSNMLEPKTIQNVICDLSVFDMNSYGSGTYRITRFGSTLQFEFNL